MSKNINAVSGEEYKVLKSNSKIKKRAYIIAAIWCALIIAPTAYVVAMHSASLKNFIVVYGVAEMNSALTEQYETLIDSTLAKIKLDEKIDAVAAKIKLPEIKIDKITDTTSAVSGATKTVGKVAGIAGAFGVKTGGLDKAVSDVANINDKIDKAVRSANDEMAKAKGKLASQLKQDIEPMIKAEIKKTADGEIQKVLKLSDKNYANFVAGRYGVLTDTSRAYTDAIYNEFLQNKTQGLKFILPLVEKYFGWIKLAFILVAIAVAFIPVMLMMKYVKMITSSFSKCPYCGKIYISKANAFNMLGILKFWK